MPDLSSAQALSESRIRTNPVQALRTLATDHFCSRNAEKSRRFLAGKIEHWLTQRVSFPQHAVTTLQGDGWLPEECATGTSTSPRVVGLVIDRDSGLGLVNPIGVTEAGGWACDRLLPFSARAIEYLFLQVCRLLVADEAVVPERYGFALASSLKENCTGNSMDVAGVLAAFDALSRFQVPEFSAACAVVEPCGESGLEPVKFVDRKLSAFIREYGQGSLLVCSPNCDASLKHAGLFEHVWAVASVEELAAKLTTCSEVIKCLSDTTALSQEYLDSILTRLRILDSQRDNSAVIDLCRRASACGMDEAVTLHARMSLDRYNRDALRHTGNCAESLGVSKTIDERLQTHQGVWSSGEQLEHAVSKAAVLIDQCDFRAADQILQGWLGTCDEDPSRFTAQRRIELWNTAGRCMIYSQAPGWESLFNRSLELQQLVDPVSRKRTESYLLHGLLRDNSLSRAEELLVTHESTIGADSLGDGFTCFYRCDLDRRKGVITDLNHPNPRCYTFAFAASSCARQTGLTAEQSSELFDQAVTTLSSLIEAWQVGPDSILRLIKAVVALRRDAIASGSDAWAHSARDLRSLQSGGVIAEAIESLPDYACVDAAESLFDALPYL